MAATIPHKESTKVLEHVSRARAGKAAGTSTIDGLVNSPVDDVAKGAVSTKAATDAASNLPKVTVDPDILAKMGYDSIEGMAAAGAAKVAQATDKVAEVVGKAALPFQIAEPIENVANMASLAGNFAPMIAPATIGVAAFGAKTLRQSSAHGRIEQFKNNIMPELSDEARAAGQITKVEKISNVAWVAGNALSIYGSAKGFTQELDSLKHMYADITGVEFNKVSTVKILTGHIPKMLEESRRHLLAEYGVRAAVQTAGLAWLLHDLKKGAINWKTGLMPMLASSAADSLMGSSLMPVYANFKNAYNRGQEIPAQDYAEFVFTGSHDLKMRGEVGQMVAQKVGEQYANAKTDPGSILKEISDGSFMVRVKGLIATAEKEHTLQVAEAKAQHDAAKIQQETAKQTNSSHKAVDMVNRVKGEKPPTVGKFTQKINNEAQATLGIT